MSKTRPFQFFFAALALAFVLASSVYVAGSLAWYAKLRIQEKISPKSIKNGFVRHPFLTGDQIPNQSLLETVTKNGKTFTYGWKLNGQACRDDVDYTERKSPRVIRWLCLGGSSLVSGTSNSNTIPCQLEELVNAGSGGKKVEIYNFGRVGWDSTQEMLAFATVFRNYRPDYLLVYDGRNDAFEAVLPRYRPFWNAWSFEIDREFNHRSYLKEIFLPVWRLKEKWLALRHPESYYEQEAHVLFQEKQVIELNFYQAHPQIGPVYTGNLENILGLAHEMGCKGAILALSPQLYWCGKPLAPEEASFDAQRIQPSWRHAMKEIFPVIQKAHHQAALSKVMPLVEVDLNPAFANRADWLFMDDCHLTDAGGHAAAELLLPSVRRTMGQNP